MTAPDPTLAPAEDALVPGRDGGPRIHLLSRAPAAAPKAVVVICPGLNAHAGQYARSAEALARHGFAVTALDLRGRGRSEGERFYVEDIAEYVSDVATAVDHARAANPGVPVFLLGHSAGGVVACCHALDHPGALSGLICESFAYRVPAPGFALAAIKGISRYFPRLKVLKLRNADFSRDPSIVAALNADPLIAGEAQPAATVAALVRANARLQTGFPAITLPLLVLHGTADKVTVPAGSRFFHETAGSGDKTLRLYEGHVHDLLADLGHETVLADIIDWAETRVASI